ncbi:hypothetical protein PLIIFM63780_000732 [Purpureocillium lilacinum]|nr:hypothetical protein PLIIFM63780_000732 [Purpureocillium lilacinum]
MQEPSIAFVLDQPEDKAHRPGDELTGRVKLLGIDRTQVRELRVQFRGISRITIPSRLPWSVPSDSIVRSDETVDLFSQRRVFAKDALRGNEDGGLSAPVSFAFTLRETSGAGSATPSAGPLPPSLRCFSQPFDCTVEYALEAELTLAQAGSRAKTCTARRVLDFEPAGGSETVEPQMVSFASSFTLAPLPHTLDVRTEGPPLSFREKFNSFIYRNRQAPSPFSIVIRASSQLVRREPLPLLVTLQLENGTVAMQRKLQVRGVTMVIERNTTVEGPGNETLQHSDKTVVIDSRELDIALPANTEVDLWPRISSLVAPELPPPTFASNGITRDYSMDVTLSVGCGDEEFQVKGSIPSLVVLPSAALDMPSLPPDDEPPSYETAMGSSSAMGTAPPYSLPESQADQHNPEASVDVKVDFEMRGRVFEFVNGEKKYWKERGMANVALQRDSCGKPRLVAKYVKTGEVCADHHITLDMKLSPIVQSDRSWTWCAGNDMSRDGSKAQTLAARFKDSASAHEFKDAFVGIQKAAA